MPSPASCLEYALTPQAWLLLLFVVAPVVFLCARLTFLVLTSTGQLLIALTFGLLRWLYLGPEVSTDGERRQLKSDHKAPRKLGALPEKATANGNQRQVAEIDAVGDRKVEEEQEEGERTVLIVNNNDDKESLSRDSASSCAENARPPLSRSDQIKAVGNGVSNGGSHRTPQQRNGSAATKGGSPLAPKNR